jgi:hypothetical protein
MQHSTKVDYDLDVDVFVFGSLKRLGLGAQGHDVFAIVTLFDGTHDLKK